jgi:hypothetical protein
LQASRQTKQGLDKPNVNGSAWTRGQSDRVTFFYGKNTMGRVRKQAPTKRRRAARRQQQLEMVQALAVAMTATRANGLWADDFQLAKD